MYAFEKSHHFLKHILFSEARFIFEKCSKALQPEGSILIATANISRIRTSARETQLFALSERITCFEQFRKKKTT